MTNALYLAYKEVTNMGSVMSAITDTVSISQFNRGLAGKIFEDVKRTGAKVVMKNNAAECVLLSPEEYTNMMDELNDARLLTVANGRLRHTNIFDAVPAADVYRELGITEEDLADADEVDIG